MDIEAANALSSFIASVGFPIAAFAAIFYLYDKTIRELTVTINKIDSTLERVITHLDMREV